MDGESGILEVKNNKTNEVLWSNSWEENVKPETFTISLKDLKKDDEYVVCFTGTKINQATIEITFESELVQESEKPLRTFTTFKQITTEFTTKYTNREQLFSNKETAALFFCP